MEKNKLTSIPSIDVEMVTMHSILAYHMNDFKINSVLLLSMINDILELPKPQLDMPESVNDLNIAENLPTEGLLNNLKYNIIAVASQLETLDNELGLERFYGEQSLYKKAMHFICIGIPIIAEELVMFLDQKELSKFTTSVQNLGDCLANIGAMPLFETALALEQASLANDLSYCKQKLPGFIERINDLQEKLSAIFLSQEKLKCCPAGNKN